MKYRKKPVVIDAWPISELVRDFLNGRVMPVKVQTGMDNCFLTFVSNGVHIRTLEGGMFGRLEDILIMGVAGEFYPCKPDIFAATYEEVTDAEA